MQTIKTAAIVVLMLTVLYGGYVSLTTPPDPLPNEIEEYLVIEEAGGMDFGGGESLASGLELGQPPAGVLSVAEPLPNEMASKTVPLLAPPTTQHADLHPDSVRPSGSYADLPTARSADLGHNAQSGPSPIILPHVAPGTANVTPGPMDSYASTQAEFQQPDPALGSAHFDPYKGTSFASGDSITDSSTTNSGTGFQMTDQPSATALETIGAAGTPQPENLGLTNAFVTADAMFAKGQLKEALATLSIFYGMPNLSESQRADLLSRLDPLAREVIYSKRHLLELPHRVTTNETLAKIAEKYSVPWQLLANVNHVDDPVTVLPGTELKIVRGPFRAEVDLTTKKMTLYLGDLYAGRFDIEVGNDPAPSPGTFTVQEKQTSHVYYDRNGNSVPAGNPNNPYGNMWLDLGGQICIHGSPNTVQPTKAGCISVAGDYADDVYGILSQGSAVTIRR